MEKMVEKIDLNDDDRNDVENAIVYFFDLMNKIEGGLDDTDAVREYNRIINYLKICLYILGENTDNLPEMSVIENDPTNEYVDIDNLKSKYLSLSEDKNFRGLTVELRARVIKVLIDTGSFIEAKDEAWILLLENYR